MLRGLFFILLFGFSAHAAKTCWRQEINPATEKIFVSASAYQAQLNDWNNQVPEMPNPLNLLTAHNLYTNTFAAQAARIRNDKVKHCYVGCRIAQRTSARTAEYVGWIKEQQDLTDCRARSHFDPVDYEATVFGARLSVETAAACLSQCRAEWPRR